MQNPSSRAGILVLVLSALALLPGCRMKPAAGAAYEPRVVLEVRNNGSFDVAVYAVPYASDGAMRLGTVGSFSARQLLVPKNSIRMNDVLVLRLHAIGSRYQWTTPELTVSQGLKACLDIESDYRGDLSRSSFFSVLSDGVSEPGATPRGACGLPVASTPK